MKKLKDLPGSELLNKAVLSKKLGGSRKMRNNYTIAKKYDEDIEELCQFLDQWVKKTQKKHGITTINEL